jgi:hypothetical protein
MSNFEFAVDDVLASIMKKQKLFGGKRQGRIGKKNAH